MAKKKAATTVTNEAAPVEPVTAAVTEVPPATPEPIDGEIDSIIARQKDGTLRGHLLKVVREYATRKIDEEEDERWAVVPTMTDAAIWDVIQWCEYERGACTQMARAVNAWATTKGGVQ